MSGHRPLLDVGGSGGFQPLEWEPGGISGDEFWSGISIDGFTRPFPADVTGLTVNVSTLLDNVSYDLEDGASLQTIDFTNLESVGNNAFIYLRFPVLETATFPSLTTIAATGGVSFSSCPNLHTVEFPVLVTAGAISLQGSTALESVEFPLLEEVYDQLDFRGCTVLTTRYLDNLVTAGVIYYGDNNALEEIEFPALVSVGAITGTIMPVLTDVELPSLTSCDYLDFQTCPVLVNVDMPVLVSVSGSTQMLRFLDCALNADSVNNILARAVAAGMTTGIIDLSGGTSSPPTGQGITDKAALILAGVTVTTN